MNYRQHRAEECQKLFLDFHPDTSKSRDPEKVLQVVTLAAQGYFSYEIAEMLGTTPKAIQKLYRRYQFPDLQNYAPPLREDRLGWQGGVKIVKGYAYSRQPGHPHASRFGSYVAVHRLVVEQHLGRFLHPSEVVHHLDEDPQNNTIENLQVFANNGEHLQSTLRGKRHNISAAGRIAIQLAVQQSNRRRAKSYTPPIPAQTETGVLPSS